MGSPIAMPALLAVETAFNQYLSLDPDAERYLRPLLGKLVHVEIAGLNANLIFLFHQHRVEVSDDFATEADVVIRGAPMSLLAMASGRAALMQSDVTVVGEIDTANRFSQLLKRLEIDWQEQLSSIAGDQTAHSLSRVASGASGWLQRAQTSMERNVADYLRDETGHLPYQWEVDEFVDGVDELRDRVDALERRFSALAGSPREGGVNHSQSDNHRDGERGIDDTLFNIDNGSR